MTLESSEKSFKLSSDQLQSRVSGEGDKQITGIISGREVSVVDSHKTNNPDREGGKALMPYMLSKLVLRIVDVSETVFHRLSNLFSEVRQEFENKTIDDTTFLIKSRAFKDEAIKLINEKETAYYQLGNRCIRVALHIILFVFSFFSKKANHQYQQLKEKDQNFHKVIGELKVMANSNQQFISATDRLTRQSINKKIDATIQAIPTILKDIENLMPLDDYQKYLQDRFSKDYPQDPNISVLGQFNEDMERGDQFKRKDSCHQIEDSEPQPAVEIINEQKTQKGVSLLQEMLKTDDDGRWMISLQLAANQTSINTIFDPPIMLFNSNSAENKWEDPVTKDDHFLRAHFSDVHPPINLEIIRDEETRQISKVKVSVNGTLDISIFNGNGHKIKLLKKNAIEGKLFYSVTLNADNCPVIGEVEKNLRGADSLE